MLRPTSTDSLCEAIKSSVQAVKLKALNSCDENKVIDACRQGRAFCFVSDDRKTTIVLEPIADEYPTVHIWIAHSTHGSAIKTYEPEIERLSRSIGAKRLTFKSTRKGYRRAMPHWHSAEGCYQRII